MTAVVTGSISYSGWIVIADRYDTKIGHRHLFQYTLGYLQAEQAECLGA